MQSASYKGGRMAPNFYSITCELFFLGGPDTILLSLKKIGRYL